MRKTGIIVGLSFFCLLYPLLFCRIPSRIKTRSLTFNKLKNTYEMKDFLFKSERQTEETVVTADLDNNGKQEIYELKKGTLTIWQNQQKIWQTPALWQVDNFFLADSNNDGKKEINLSVWKKGNYGSSKPFWVKENDQSIRNHFFVFLLKNGQVKPIWQSSNLTRPNCEFIFADANNDSKNELIVLEGDYQEKNCRGQYLAVWQWNGWGYTNQWRSQLGNFRNLDFKKVKADNEIIVETF